MPVLPREQAVGQREIGDERDVRTFALGDDVVFRVALQEAVLVLRAREARRAVACRLLHLAQ